MTSTVPATQNIETDVWVKASWQSFVALADDPTYEQGRFYYDRGYLRIEMAPLGPAHGHDNSIVSNVVVIFATLNNIRMGEYTNTSFWRTGVRGCQPDIAFYLGAEFRFPPYNNSPVNVVEFGAPSLVIEIGSSTFKDDLGGKRLLYEQLGIQEYWVVHVSQGEVYGFEVSDGRSGRIQTSKVLPGLDLAIAEEALQRSQTEDDGTINRWLLQLFGTTS